MDLNRITLLGHCGREPEVKTFSNGGRMAKFSLATSRSYKKGDEWQQVTQWHNVVVKADNLIDRVERDVKKGSRVYLEGQCETRSYEKDGSNVYITEIVVAPFSGNLWVEGKNGTGGGATAHDAIDDALQDEVPF